MTKFDNPGDRRPPARGRWPTVMRLTIYLPPSIAPYIEKAASRSARIATVLHRYRAIMAATPLAAFTNTEQAHLLATFAAWTPRPDDRLIGTLSAHYREQRHQGTSQTRSLHRDPFLVAATPADFAGLVGSCFRPRMTKSVNR